MSVMRIPFSGDSLLVLGKGTPVEQMIEGDLYGYGYDWLVLFNSIEGDIIKLQLHNYQLGDIEHATGIGTEVVLAYEQQPEFIMLLSQNLPYDVLIKEFDARDWVETVEA